MLAKIITKHLVKQMMFDAASDPKEEMITLVRKRGKKGAKEMEILVRFNGSLDRIPMYVAKIVESAAKATNVSFTEMIQHTETCHDLMLEVSSNKETITKMEDKK